MKTPELNHDELIAKVRPDVNRLLNGLGPSLGLGKLTDFSFESARSRCAESQVAVTANYEKKGGARLLIYGRSRGAAYSIEQFQWTR